jgi:sensor histidine kinase YesM
VTGVVIFLFFFLWVHASERVLDQLAAYFGEAFLGEFRLPAQLVLLVLATGLAIAFVVASREVLSGLDLMLTEVFQIRLTIPPPRSLDPAFLDLYKRANIGCFVMLMLSGFYLITIRRADWQLKTLHQKAEQLENENNKAQLSALQNQINPHFLFNSLSIVASLAHQDANLTERYIGQLSRTFRYILAQQDCQQVTLQTELAFIESYLYLLHIRFENKLDVRIDVLKNPMEQYMVAPFTLQLLLENAVQHNQMSDEVPLRVDIRQEGDELVVRNTLRPRPVRTPTTGLGLQNIVNRYALLTSRPVWAGESDGTFTVRIPLLY